MLFQNVGQHTTVDKIGYGNIFLVARSTQSIFCIKGYIKFGDEDAKDYVVAIAPGHDKIGLPGIYEMAAFQRGDALLLKSCTIVPDLDRTGITVSDRLAEQNGAISLAEAPFMTVTAANNPTPFAVNLKSGQIDKLRMRGSTHFYRWHIVQQLEGEASRKTLFTYPDDLPAPEEI